jgi:ankyrin repeat protein
VSTGLAKLVQLLLEHEGIDANFKDSDSLALLSLAEKRGYQEIVQLELKYKDIDANFKDSYSRTPLSWAAENGHEAAI